MSETLEALIEGPGIPPAIPQHSPPGARGGRLNRGGTFPNAGRPPDALTKALRAVGKKGVATVLKPLIEGKPVKVLARQRDEHGQYVDEIVEVDPEPGVRVKAVDIALKYGLATDRKDSEKSHRPVLLIGELHGDMNITLANGHDRERG